MKWLVRHPFFWLMLLNLVAMFLPPHNIWDWISGIGAIGAIVYLIMDWRDDQRERNDA